MSESKGCAKCGVGFGPEMVEGFKDIERKRASWFLCEGCYDRIGKRWSKSRGYWHWYEQMDAVVMELRSLRSSLTRRVEESERDGHGEHAEMLRQIRNRIPEV